MARTVDHDIRAIPGPSRRHPCRGVDARSRFWNVAFSSGPKPLLANVYRALTATKERPHPLRPLRPAVARRGRRRCAPAQVLPDRDRQSAASAAAGARGAAAVARSVAIRCAARRHRRGARSGTRRTGSPSAGRLRPCSIGSHTPIRSAAPWRRPASRSRTAQIDRDHSRLRRAICSARSRRNDFIPGLRGLQPDRRSGFSRPRSPDRAARPRRPQPTRTPRCCSTWRAPSSRTRRPRPSSIRPGAGLPSGSGRRCRSATAPPITTPSMPRR